MTYRSLRWRREPRVVRKTDFALVRCHVKRFGCQTSFAWSNDVCSSILMSIKTRVLHEPVSAPFPDSLHYNIAKIQVASLMTMGALLQSGLNLCQATSVKVPTDLLITEPRGLLHKMPMASVEHGVEILLC